jgi:hypothetical protein
VFENDILLVRLRKTIKNLQSGYSVCQARLEPGISQYNSESLANLLGISREQIIRISVGKVS